MLPRISNRALSAWQGVHVPPALMQRARLVSAALDDIERALEAVCNRAEAADRCLDRGDIAGAREALAPVLAIFRANGGMSAEPLGEIEPHPDTPIERCPAWWLASRYQALVSDHVDVANAAGVLRDVILTAGDLLREGRADHALAALTPIIRQYDGRSAGGRPQ